jgi:hypothetical protein
VHEALLKLVDAPSASWKSQGHLYAMASKVMRSVLVDHARERKAQKRGGDLVRVPLIELAQAPGSESADAADEYDALDVNETLEALAGIETVLSGPEHVNTLAVRSNLGPAIMARSTRRARESPDFRSPSLGVRPVRAID